MSQVACGCCDMPEEDKGPCLCPLCHGSFWFILPPSILEVAVCTNGVVCGSLLGIVVEGCPGCSLAGPQSMGWENRRVGAGPGREQHCPHPTPTLYLIPALSSSLTAQRSKLLTLLFYSQLTPLPNPQETEKTTVDMGAHPTTLPTPHMLNPRTQ